MFVVITVLVYNNNFMVKTYLVFIVIDFVNVDTSKLSINCY